MKHHHTVGLNGLPRVEIGIADKAPSHFGHDRGFDLPL